MRVLYLTHQYYPRHVGGTELYTRALARWMRRAGHDVLVVTAAEETSNDPSRTHVERLVLDEVPVAELHFNLSLADHPARAEHDNPWTGAQVASELAAFRPDVVHAVNPMKLSGSALDACHRAGVPVVSTLCDFWSVCPRHTLVMRDGVDCTGPGGWKCASCVTDLHQFAPPPRGFHGLGPWLRDVRALRARPAFLRRALLRSSRIVALSSEFAQTLAEHGIDRDRIEVIEHGLDEDDVGGPQAARWRPRDGVPGSSALRVGFVGSVVAHKGLDVLLAALALARGLAVELHVHAPPSSTPYGLAVGRAAASDPRVRMHGRFEPSRFGEVLRSVDVLAVPSSAPDNHPMVAKAALHLGVPMLASRVLGLASMLDGERRGWLVAPRDPAAWAAALHRVASEPLPRFEPRRMKTIDENAAEMLRIYEDVAKEGR